MAIKYDGRIVGLHRPHPEFGRRAEELEQYLFDAYKARVTKTYFKVFECFRSSDRQNSLFAKGVSKAKAGQSAHNYGLAADFVPWINGHEAAAIGHGTVPGWSWHPSHDYDFLKKAAEKFGLEAPLAWDKCHVQLPNWKKFAK